MFDIKSKKKFEPKRLTILGSTGSIGTQALEVAENLNCPITALAANSNIKLIEKQVRKFSPKVVAIFNGKAAKDLKIKIRDTDTKVLTGIEGLCEVASMKTDLLLNSVVGMIGLEPTMAAINAGNQIALANKETLVAGGELVMNSARNAGVSILPVDSEHSAIFQCLEGMPPDKKISKLILTASGGPFFDKTKEELKDITPAQALKHPNWDMGAKITIDSATLMNKGLEFIEAYWLFGVPAENIDIVVHRESIIHSLVEYVDGSVIAQLGVPDMRLPIQYAITYPHRLPIKNSKALELADIGKISFYKPDMDTFISLKACIKALEKGGLYPAAVNSANEEAVRLFLEEKISFLEIGKIASGILEEKLPEVNRISEKAQLHQILEVSENIREKIKMRY